MDLPTRLDLFSRGRAYIQRTARKINPALVDVEGTNANIYVSVAAILASAVVRAIGYEASKLMLDSAQGVDLDRLVFDRYRFTRKGASPSRCDVTISRPTFAAGAGTIPVGTRFKAGPIEFVTTTAASLGATDLTTVARVRSVKAGADTRAPAGAINAFARIGDLWDRSLVVTNGEAAAGGEDAEKDEPFRERARAFKRASARGTLSAIEFGAMTVDGVAYAVASEISAGVFDAAFAGGYRDLPSFIPARIVELYIADTSGVASRALAADVETALLEWRAAGVTVIVRTSLPQIVPVVVRVSYRANVDTVSLQNAIRQAIVSFVSTLPPNRTLYVSDLVDVLKRFSDVGVIVEDGAVVSPAGDLVPDVGRSIRTTVEAVTVTTPAP